MNKNDNVKENSDKKNSIPQQIPLKITNKDMNKIDFLNFQQYYNLLKKFKRENINLSLDFIENLYNMNNSNKNPKLSPFSIKLRKDIRHLSQHVYKDKNLNNNRENTEENKTFKDKYNFIINSVNFGSPIINIQNNNKHKLNPLKNKFPFKNYYVEEKNKNINRLNNNINIKNEEKRNNTIESININYNNKKKIKFQYGNYALNSTNFNHPQFYILNNNHNNNDDDEKEKLPFIESNSGFKFKRTGDLSYLIPHNNKKLKVRDNFYNYYIGMKLSKSNF